MVLRLRLDPAAPGRCYERDDALQTQKYVADARGAFSDAADVGEYAAQGFVRRALLSASLAPARKDIARELVELGADLLQQICRKVDHLVDDRCERADAIGRSARSGKLRCRGIKGAQLCIADGDEHVLR